MRLLRYPDFKARGIVNNRMTFRRWIAEQGFPAGISSGQIRGPGPKTRSRRGSRLGSALRAIGRADRHTQKENPASGHWPGSEMRPRGCC